VISKSSTEAEYRCLARLRCIGCVCSFCELKVSLESVLVVWCDNISALAIASNPIFYIGSKHIEVNYHFICEKVANRDIILQHVPTSLQLADVFVKGYTAHRFCLLQDKLSLCVGSGCPCYLQRNDKDKNWIACKQEGILSCI
jgi:hypothetical protein